MKLEHPACELCGSTEHRLVMSVRDKRHGFPGEFGLVECTQCSLRFLSPRPTRESIVAAYPTDYTAHRREESVARWRAPFAWAWDRYQRLFLGNSYPVFYYRAHRDIFGTPGRKPRILDVGCGSGSKLLYLKRAGWETFGLDFSQEAIDLALKNGVDHGVAGDGGSLPHDDRFFDAVMSWHSLEHHFHPKESLREMRRVLAPGGYGIVAVPTGDNLGLRLFKENWGPLEPPRHLYHFTKETLGRMVEEAGLEIVRFHYDYTYYGLFLDEEILESVENLAADRGVNFRFPRPPGYSLIARIPVLPFSELLGRLCRGMNLIVHFKRPE